MTPEQFNNVLDQRIQLTRDLLASKAEEYAPDVDRLRNFKLGGVIQGITPEKCLLGYWTKHLCSIIDMINSEDTYPQFLWNDKIGDAINYLILLEALTVERRIKPTIANTTDATTGDL
jgi:hypothetical protein